MKRPSKKQLRREIAAVLEHIKDREHLEFVFGCVFGSVASAMPRRLHLIPEHFRPTLARIQATADVTHPAHSAAESFRESAVELTRQLSLPKMDVN